MNWTIFWATLAVFNGLAAIWCGIGWRLAHQLAMEACKELGWSFPPDAKEPR